VASEVLQKEEHCWSATLCLKRVSFDRDPVNSLGKRVIAVSESC
jgi:hypothetical protein